VVSRLQVAPRLLLDEMFPKAMADQLNAKGHDVRAVVAGPNFIGLPDEEILLGAGGAIPPGGIVFLPRT
jgi:hypothetical protein